MAEAFDETFWDELYGSKDKLWSGNANPYLVAEAAELTPGRALDVGSGEGGDAIWLAGRGWTVTGIDLSTVALARAAQHAADAGAHIARLIEWKHVDLATWEPPNDGFDLVTAHYMHLPQPLRDNVYRGLASSVAPGGSLLVVGHAPSELNTHMHGTDTRDFFFTGEQIGALLGAGWDIVTNREAAGRTHTQDDGTEVKTFDVIFRAQRSS